MKKIFTILAIAAVALASCNKAPKTVAVTGVTLDQAEITLNVGETAVLAATVAPKDAENQKITWASSDEQVAKVENGTVTAVAVGPAVITVTTVDGGFKAECKVTVKEITWTPILTEDFANNPIRTAFNREGAWIPFCINPALPAGLTWNWCTAENLWVPTRPNCLYASSYWGPAYESEAWCVSKEIDLTDAKYAKINFLNVCQYVQNPETELGLYVQESVDQPEIAAEEGIWWGGPAGVRPNGTWEQVAIPNLHVSTDGYDFEPSGDCLINDYAGMKIRIAFKYIGTTAGAGTWAIDDLVVSKGE